MLAAFTGRPARDSLGQATANGERFMKRLLSCGKPFLPVQKKLCFAICGCPFLMHS
jgi:hypothetical protein